MPPFLYGLVNASHDFTSSKSLGKNIFTNAAPLAFAQYLSMEKKLDIPLVAATVSAEGELSTKHVMTPWSEIISSDPEDAYFQFEGVFDGYKPYTHGNANKSDVVIADKTTKEHLRPLEIKLVVVPTSASASKNRNDQSCEIVTRPPTVEQLAFSIAHSYGPSKKSHLQDIIQKALGQPNDIKWADTEYMIEKLPEILTAAKRIITDGISGQTPLVMTAVWRSEGQKPVLDEEAFDVFVWTDLAFVQLFTDTTYDAYYYKDGSKRENRPTDISRPSRALIWLIKCLWDYTTQNTLNFGKVHSEITYGVQSDKAASFTGQRTLKHLQSEEFLHPRISRDEVEKIIQPAAFDSLLPERRLDAALAIQHLVNQQKEAQ